MHRLGRVGGERGAVHHARRVPRAGGRQRQRAVIADIRELEFASSSCIKAFVAWLQQIQQLDDAQRYKVRFRSNPRYAWQQRSLTALAAFAAGVVEIEAS